METYSTSFVADHYVSSKYSIKILNSWQRHLTQLLQLNPLLTTTVLLLLKYQKPTPNFF